MNRRKLIRNLTLGALATAAVPAWANRWSLSDLPELKPLSIADEKLLNNMAQGLIPKTDTPGAGDLGADKFVRAMIEAMYDEAYQQKFYAQLAKVDGFARATNGKAFSELSVTDQTDCLSQMSERKDAAWKGFYATFKRYTIQGYMGSEYVMTEINGYVMAPGYFNGCVPV